MDASEKDEVPMLSATQLLCNEHTNSPIWVSARTRSASMSLPMNYMDYSKHENDLVGFTGPLRNERQTSFKQISGPLYVSHKHVGNLQPNQGALRLKDTESNFERYPSLDGMVRNGWPDDNYAGRNEHLLRSGQLGMCNDPYCTVCPTSYNFKGQQKVSSTSDIYDAKVLNSYCYYPYQRVKERIFGLENEVWVMGELLLHIGACILSCISYNN